MNKKIALSALSILTSLTLVGAGAFAFFSDTETSAGNVFKAGAIDLKIDNESFYNGQLSQDTSWGLNDLTVEKFFNFTDVKPEDYGEDTISVHVNNNPAWACADVKLTSNDDNGLTESEAETGDNVLQGELANRINFTWWADDGDNVLEIGERDLPGGPLGALGVGNSATVTLADSKGSIFNPLSLDADGALIGGNTYHIGKAWCFGAISAAPLPQGDYLGPDANNDGDQTAGTPADGGILCDGSGEGNETQTDSLTADVSFRAIQSRNNGAFECNPPLPT